MDDISAVDGSGRYEICLKGHLDTRWEIWFDGMTLTTWSDGTTSIRGPVVDQSALHGLLQRVRDLGLPLISVTLVEPDQPDPPNSRNPLTPRAVTAVRNSSNTTCSSAADARPLR